MADFAYTPGTRHSAGNEYKVPVTATWSSSTYTASGEYLYASMLGLNVITDVQVEDSKTYLWDANIASDGSYFRLKAYVGTTGTSGATSGGTPAGTIDQVTGTNAQVTGTVAAPVIGYRTGEYLYMKGSANTNSDAADQSASPTNGAYLYALAAANNTTTISAFAAQPDYQRNVCVCHKNNSGGAAVAQVACVYTVNGTLNGSAQQDTITFADTSSVANTKFRYMYGTKPFDTVTSITINFAQNANMQRSVGLGSKVLLARNLYTPAESDVVMITAQGLPVTITSTVDTTNNTVNFGARADNDHVLIKYGVKSYPAAPGITCSTPAFTGSTPGFTGSALATHIHTLSGVLAEASGSVSMTTDIYVYGY